MNAQKLLGKSKSFLLNKTHLAPALILTILITISCSSSSPSVTPNNIPATSSKTSQKTSSEIALKSRLEVIPSNAIKVMPELDILPPKLHSSAYQAPIPLDDGVNTAGGEDSAFILPDGKTIYFFFTPDVNVPAEKQLLDGVTGIWVSRNNGSKWSQSERVLLQDRTELALDGCVFVWGNELWFGSARKGNYRSIDIWKANFADGKWSNWQNAGEKLNLDYEAGEFHITADGSEMYFHSGRAGGKGAYDIWMTKLINGEWQDPISIDAVNTSENEGWPFITQDGRELWFTRFYMGSPSIFVSKKFDSNWSKPELILSQFAAEPSRDTAGNIYFTHHFFKDNKMIEADIYVAYRK